ncbi:hypothetical protein B0T18DRAFT_405115 [Schizothecium vesticola]|uniref:Uncharacterized protein n=1 Tax=Schizothecium vesticola TaxID=314040 RepID=A0AA40F7G2_9PEZI|nr:hypothetical protein B0T18DRAFT_405115 [Schizothecium vesticola]
MDTFMGSVGAKGHDHNSDWRDGGILQAEQWRGCLLFSVLFIEEGDRCEYCISCLTPSTERGDQETDDKPQGASQLPLDLDWRCDGRDHLVLPFVQTHTVGNLVQIFTI